MGGQLGHVLRLRSFRSDRTSGAYELALTALDILEDAIARSISSRELNRLRRTLAGAHPAMAPVWNAAHAPDPAAFRKRLERGRKQCVRNARRFLPRGAVVTTLSYSSTVLELLARRDLRVIVAESLPGGEGARTARLLRRRGVSARLIRDAELGVYLNGSDVAVTGADAVTPAWVINKVGTSALALASREAGVRCYAVCDSSKLVPATWSIPPYSRRRPFEQTRRRLFTAVITDR